MIERDEAQPGGAEPATDLLVALEHFDEAAGTTQRPGTRHARQATADHCNLVRHACTPTPFASVDSRA